MRSAAGTRRTSVEKRTKRPDRVVSVAVARAWILGLGGIVWNGLETDQSKLSEGCMARWVHRFAQDGHLAAPYSSVHTFTSNFVPSSFFRDS